MYIHGLVPLQVNVAHGRRISDRQRRDTRHQWRPEPQHASPLTHSRLPATRRRGIGYRGQLRERSLLEGKPHSRQKTPRAWFQVAGWRTSCRGWQAVAPKLQHVFVRVLRMYTVLFQSMTRALEFGGGGCAWNAQKAKPAVRARAVTAIRVLEKRLDKLTTNLDSLAGIPPVHSTKQDLATTDSVSRLLRGASAPASNAASSAAFHSDVAMSNNRALGTRITRITQKFPSFSDSLIRTPDGRPNRTTDPGLAASRRACLLVSIILGSTTPPRAWHGTSNCLHSRGSRPSWLVCGCVAVDLKAHGPREASTPPHVSVHGASSLLVSCDALRELLDSPVCHDGQAVVNRAAETVQYVFCIYV